jgi:cation diffusion facilitator family transporter
MTVIERAVDNIVALFHLNRGNRFKKYGYFEGILSVIVNVLLFVIKLVFGILLNSISLMADSFHSLSDVITSTIVIFGFRMSSKPPDAKHPFGHGRAERIAAIVIACLLIVAGLEFFRSGFARFKSPLPIRADVSVIAMLFVSILLKEFLYRISLSLGRRIGSVALRADAWHHRTDAISTVLVLIGFVSFRFGLFSLDGIVGMAVALVIVYTGIAIIKESGSVLIGEAPASSLLSKIEETAADLDGINDVHHIHVHDYGGQLEVTIHVRVKGDTHLDDAHDKASEVEEAIKKCVPGAEVTVHVEPLNDDERA